MKFPFTIRPEFSSRKKKGGLRLAGGTTFSALALVSGGIVALKDGEVGS